jgi:L-iditol 2-dehydrogenase
MISSYLVRPGHIELREIPTPVPSRGEVLVRVRAALTCGTDLKAFLRGHPLIPMPGPFGHEYAGIVAAAGKGVRRFREGDEVMGVHTAPCRACMYCRKGLYNLCEHIMEDKVLGAFSEYILLPEGIVRQNLFPKPAALRHEEAACLEPLSCVVHGMEGTRIRQGDYAFVIGTGAIGLLHLLLLKNLGARVIVTGLEEDRLALARELGADDIIPPMPPKDLEEAVKAVSGGPGCDAVFECTGQPDVWQNAVHYVRRGGTVVLFGGCREGTSVTYDTYRLHYDELTIRGAFHYTPANVRKARQFLLNGLAVSRLISGACPLAELPAAFGKLSRGEGVKYAVLP